MWGALAGNAVYLDSNIIIFAIERGSRWTTVLHALFEAIETRLIDAFTSEVTLAEVLKKPLEKGDKDLVARYEALFAEDSPIIAMAVDKTILRSTARLESQLGVKLVDGIHVATALECGCDVFLTEDIRLCRKLGQPRWIPLDDVASNNV